MTKRHSFIARNIRKFVSKMTEVSYMRLGGLYGAMIVAFGCAYYALATLAPGHGPSIGGGPPIIRLLNAIYFSIITAASVGYGDISPHGISKILASVESVLSLFTFAILVSKPVSERQEATLIEMHALTLNENFRSIREGFYIIRRDCDTLEKKMRSGEAIDEHDLDILRSIFEQSEVLMSDIPTFYDAKRGHYVIDQLREKLLAQSVMQTLERILRTLQGLQKKHAFLVAGTKHEREMMQTTCSHVLRTWKSHAASNISTMINACENMLHTFSPQHG